MKKIVTIFIFCLGVLFGTNNIIAQFDSPVSWEFEISEEPNIMGLYEMTYTATIEDKWHMYSLNLPSPDAGPLPTVFTFEKSDFYTIAGKVAEQTTPHSVFDAVFEVKVNYFDGKAVFKQLVKLEDEKKGTTVKGSVSYMVCNESTCLPPTDVNFELPIKVK